jgi:CubicO group peptidase (beta-lactamase class C family)
MSAPVRFALGWLAALIFRPMLIAAPGPEATDLAAVLEPIRASNGVPGLAAIVLSGDRLVAQGAVGVREAGAAPALTIQDKFHLGSDTKAMTATLIALLVEQSQLKWDTTVGEIFSKVADPIDPAWRNVTLAQLLAHRAGAPHELEPTLWSRLWEMRGTPTEQRLQLVRGVVSRPPVNPPGTTYLYSNAGFAIAGAMAETVTGQPWETLMQERLFRPLAITTAGFGAPGTKGALDQPVGHTAAGEPVPVGPHADNPPGTAPAGAVHMSLPDWARFITLHLRGDPASPHREARLLRPESFAWLHEPASGPGEKYAAGWAVLQRSWARGAGESARGLVLHHAGSNTMWYCIALLAPERDVAVLIACNRGGDAAARACDQVAAALIKNYLPKN